MSSSISKLVYAHAGAVSPGRQNVWQSVVKGMPAPKAGCGTREHRMQVRGLPLSSRVSLALRMEVRRVKGCFQSTRRAPSFPELLTGLLGFLVLPGVKGHTNTHLVNTPCGLPLDFFRSSLMGGLDRNGLSAGSSPACGVGCFDVKGGAISDQMPRPNLLPPIFKQGIKGDAYACLYAEQRSRQCTWRRLNVGGIHRSVATKG